MAATTIFSDFGAQENSVSLFPSFPHLFAMKSGTGCHNFRFFFKFIFLLKDNCFREFCCYLNFFFGYRSVLFGKQKKVHPWGVRVSQPKGEVSILLGFILLYICLLRILNLSYASWDSLEGSVFIFHEALTPVHRFSFVPFL